MAMSAALAAGAQRLAMLSSPAFSRTPLLSKIWPKRFLTSSSPSTKRVMPDVAEELAKLLKEEPGSATSPRAQALVQELNTFFPKVEGPVPLTIQDIAIKELAMKQLKLESSVSVNSKILFLSASTFAALLMAEKTEVDTMKFKLDFFQENAKARDEHRCPNCKPVVPNQDEATPEGSSQVAEEEENSQGWAACWKKWWLSFY